MLYILYTTYKKHIFYLISPLISNIHQNSLAILTAKFGSIILNNKYIMAKHIIMNLPKNQLQKNA